MNKCDLEETKHMALQKFLELAEKPQNWDVPEYGSTTCGKFIISQWPNGIFLGREYLRPLDLPEWREPINWSFLTEEDKQKELNAHSLICKKYESDEVLVAVNKIRSYQKEQVQQQRCEKIKKDMEEQCIRIQKELRPWYRFW